MHPRGYSSYTQVLTCHRSSKGWALPDKDQAALPRQFKAELRSLNDCTACCTQASKVSVQPGAQSTSGVLKGTINPLSKPDERLSFYNLATTEKSATMCTDE